MALRSSVSDSFFIETKRKVVQEVYTIIFGTSVTYRRNRTIIDGEWVALTEAAATGYVDTHAGDTNSTFEAVEDNRICGSWKVIKHIDSRGALTADT